MNYQQNQQSVSINSWNHDKSFTEASEHNHQQNQHLQCNQQISNEYDEGNSSDRRRKKPEYNAKKKTIKETSSDLRKNSQWITSVKQKETKQKLKQSLFPIVQNQQELQKKQKRQQIAIENFSLPNIYFQAKQKSIFKDDHSLDSSFLIEQSLEKDNIDYKSELMDFYVQKELKSLKNEYYPQKFKAKSSYYYQVGFTNKQKKLKQKIGKTSKVQNELQKYYEKQLKIKENSKYKRLNIENSLFQNDHKILEEIQRSIDQRKNQESFQKKELSNELLDSNAMKQDKSSNQFQGQNNLQKSRRKTQNSNRFELVLNQKIQQKFIQQKQNIPLMSAIQSSKWREYISKNL